MTTHKLTYDDVVMLEDARDPDCCDWGFDDLYEDRYSFDHEGNYIDTWCIDRGPLKVSFLDAVRVR